MNISRPIERKLLFLSLAMLLTAIAGLVAARSTRSHTSQSRLQLPEADRSGGTLMTGNR